MANTIQIKRGTKETTPLLSQGEIGVNFYDDSFYIGKDNAQNIKFINESKVNENISNSINNFSNELNKNELNVLLLSGETLGEKLITGITKAISLGYKSLRLPVGVYEINSTITTPQAFNQVNIIGEDAKGTIIKLNNCSSLKFKGGSGQLSSGFIDNLTIQGTDQNSQVGLILEDVCGFTPKNIIFDNLFIGCKFLNDTGFTEYCVLTDCEFRGSVITPVVYQKKSSSSAESFHGSGLKNCLINQNDNCQASIIINDGCVPYNSPMDFSIWTHSTPKPLILNNGNYRGYCYGTIRIESFNYTKFKVVEGNEFNFIGNILGFGSNYDSRNIKFMENIRITNDGGVQRINVNYSGGVVLPSTSGDTKILETGNDIMLTYMAIGAFFRQCGTIIVGKNPQADELTITELQKHSFFDQNGRGSLTFKANGKSLMVTTPNGIQSLEMSYNVKSLN